MYLSVCLCDVPQFLCPPNMHVAPQNLLHSSCMLFSSQILLAYFMFGFFSLKDLKICSAFAFALGLGIMGLPFLCKNFTPVCNLVLFLPINYRRALSHLMVLQVADPVHSNEEAVGKR